MTCCWLICKDWQELKAAEVFVKRFKSQEVFVPLPYDFHCANGTITPPDCHRPLSEAEGNLSPDDVQFETCVKEGSTKMKLQNGHNSMPNYNQLAATVESMRFRPMTRITSR